MQIIDSLSTALSGLQTAQKLLQTTSSNIVNSQTPGYTRKTQDAVTNVVTGGVMAGTVQRTVDEALLRRLRLNLGDQAYADTTAAALQKLTQAAGDPAAGQTISAKLEALGTAYQQLATNPQDIASGQAVLSAASDLANTISSYANTATQLQQDTRSDIQTTVTTVNQQLQQIATLNSLVAQAKGRGDDPSDLQDQRDTVLNDLSKNISVRAFIDSNGTMNVYSSDYKLLASNYAEVISYANAGGSTASTADIFRTSQGTLTGVGGQLGAEQDLVKTVIPGVLNQIDEVARQIANGFATPAGNAMLNPATNAPTATTTGSIGVQLFTNTSGAYPAPVAPPYFATSMQVNSSYFNSGTAQISAAGLVALRSGDTIAAGASSINNSTLSTSLATSITGAGVTQISTNDFTTLAADATNIMAQLVANAAGTARNAGSSISTAVTNTSPPSTAVLSQITAAITAQAAVMGYTTAQATTLAAAATASMTANYPGVVGAAATAAAAASNAATPQPLDVTAAITSQQFLQGGTLSFAQQSGQSLSLKDAASNIVILIGQQQTIQQNQSKSLGVFQTQMQAQLSKTSDVSLDTEMSNLISLQNLYQANAKVTSTAQQMLDQLMGLIR